MTSSKINLLGLNNLALRQWMLDHGEKVFHAEQITKWVYQQGVLSFDHMTNLGKNLRNTLNAEMEIRLPTLADQQPSTDGTCKWVLRLDCGNCIETVFIPEKRRGTLCISSQVGCVLNCQFCSTATQGFNRNLAAWEITGQILFAAHALGIPKNHGQRVITNVVFMGMGEPLLNFDPVVAAVDLMLDDNAFGISKRRVTLSTAGLVPQMDRLTSTLDISLAVSLHAPTNALRDELVPLNKKYPIEELLLACQRYIANKPHRKVTIEYVMLKDFNDSDQQAHELAQLLKGLACKINLIPFNPYPGTRFQCSDVLRMERFRDILFAEGFTVIIRRTRGGDIDAACGQLVGRITDRTRRNAQWQAQLQKGITL